MRWNKFNSTSACPSSPRGTATIPSLLTLSISRQVGLERASSGWLSRTGIFVSCSRIRERFFTAVVSKCLLPSCSIAALTPSPMLPLPSSPFSTMSRAKPSLSSSIVLVLMDLPWSSPVARSSFLPFYWLRYFSAPSIVGAQQSLNNISPPSRA
jgi:hypothetical protein